MSISEDPRVRETNATTSHTLFRGLNEHLKELNEAFSLGIPVRDWVCECANTSCVARVELAAAEYEAVRRNRRRFFVAPSDEHVWPDVERVTVRNELYWIVETIGRAAELSRTDPGSGDARAHLRT